MFAAFQSLQKRDYNYQKERELRGTSFVENQSTLLELPSKFNRRCHRATCGWVLKAVCFGQVSCSCERSIWGNVWLFRKCELLGFCALKVYLIPLFQQNNMYSPCLASQNASAEKYYNRRRRNNSLTNVCFRHIVVYKSFYKHRVNEVHVVLTTDTNQVGIVTKFTTLILGFWPRYFIVPLIHAITCIVVKLPIGLTNHHCI